ncbi:hypothetical protein EON81_04710 [bacterium]|nr:MAG: hypothetical protein EON81_04710 [bacterium]
MRTPALALLALVCVVGCGGGSGGTENPGLVGTENQFGPISTRGQITGAPIVRDLRTISTVALAGTIVDATYRPQSKPDNQTAIAISSGNYIEMMFDTGEQLETWLPLYSGARMEPRAPRWSPDGQRLYFLHYGTNRGLYYVTASAPSTAVQVIAGALSAFQISPNGTTLIYAKQPVGESDSEIFRSTISGTGEVRLTTNSVDDRMGTWIDDTSFFLDRGDADPGIYNLSGVVMYGLPVSGGKTIGRSLDGRYFLYDSAGSTDYQCLLLERINNYFGYNLYLPNDVLSDLYSAAPSPDGQKWLIGGVYSAYITELRPQTRNYLKESTTSYLGWGDWQPALGVTKFVGTSGRLGTTSAGIVATYRSGYGQNGLSSFVNWDAQTRSTSTVSDDVTDIDASTKTYTIEADRLTALRYGNRPFFANVSTVGSTGTANGAIVTINSEYGLVASIVVYQETRGAKPTVRKEGDRKIVEGSILGVWNAKGENLAPNGATRVTLNEKGEPQPG